jgi:hypothetical protein
MRSRRLSLPGPSPCVAARDSVSKAVILTCTRNPHRTEYDFRIQERGRKMSENGHTKAHMIAAVNAFGGERY